MINWIKTTWRKFKKWAFGLLGVGAVALALTIPNGTVEVRNEPTYFAEIDSNGAVKNVIVADQGFINSGLVGNPQNWIQTWMDSGNRGRYAGVGYMYHKNFDKFFPHKPFDSWVASSSGEWVAPKAKHKDGKSYRWNESLIDWELIRTSSI